MYCTEQLALVGRLQGQHFDNVRSEIGSVLSSMNQTPVDAYLRDADIYQRVRRGPRSGACANSKLEIVGVMLYRNKMKILERKDTYEMVHRSTINREFLNGGKLCSFFTIQSLFKLCSQGYD